MSQHRAALRRLPSGEKPAPENGNGRTSVLTTRLNLKLPNTVFNELQNLSQESGRTMTEIVRIGLALAALAADEQKAGRKLAVIDTSGRIVKEIVFAK